MISKEFVTVADHTIVRITFTLPSSLAADKIYLVGDHNDWDETSHPFHRNHEGDWVLTLELEPGRAYQFRYLLDADQWLNDHEADAYAQNRFGTSNFVVITDPTFTKREG